MIKSWENRNGINQDKFLKNLTEFLKDWIKFSDEERDEYFKKFLKHGEEKECKVTFLSRVLKYREETLLSTLYNYHINEKEFKEFQEKIKRIRELYFTINPRLTENIKLDQKRIEYLINQTSSYINQTSSYIISGTFLNDKLDFHYNTFRQRTYTNQLKSQIKEKQKNSIEDLKNNFLELLKQAPKEAFKSQEDLFYYLLLKGFCYFKKLNKDNCKKDFFKECNSIYTITYINKIKITNKFKPLLFNRQIIKDLKTKFKNFHDLDDYKSKLKILEEKKKNYPDFCDNKDCNNFVVNDDELNKSNDSWIEGSMNISQTNSPDNSNNGNKRKLEEEDKNPKIINFKKRLRNKYFKQNPDNSDTCYSQGIKKPYTNFSINSILGIEVQNNTKLNYLNFSIENILGIKKSNNKNLFILNQNIT